MLQLQNENKVTSNNTSDNRKITEFYELNLTMPNKTWCYSYKTREKNDLPLTLVTTESPQNFNIT